MNNTNVFRQTLVLLLLIAFWGNAVIAQIRVSDTRKSNTESYFEAVQQQINNQQFDGFMCASPETSAAELDASRAACSQVGNGYGTNCWSPTSGLPSNRDPACTNPALPNSGCGNYKVPIAIVVMENASWTGTNYIGGTGFAQLPDADLDLMISNLNAIYQNAQIEFYECKSRQRVNNPDLYNFYSSNSDPEDAINDETESAAYDTPNVLTLYFVGGLSGDHDCCGYLGYANFPPSRDFAIMRYAAVNGPIVAHELGHYFGLFHTHRNLPSLTSGGDANGVPGDALNNCECLTKGDGICDTWPDPNFATTCPTSCGGGTCFITGSTCDFSEAGYSCVNNGASLTINPSLGVDVTTGVSTILEKNFMSYNQVSNCRNAFTPCQYRKMNDVLMNCRSYLCYPDITRDFNSTVLNNAQSPYKEICVGDPSPTFTAKNGCYKWFAEATGSGATPLFTGNSFTPTVGTGASQLNTNLIGLQDFWIEDVNEFQSPACRRQVTVNIVPRPGIVSLPDNALCCNETVTFASNNIAIDTCNQVIAWWRTTTPFTNYAAAETAFNTLTTAQKAAQISNSTTSNGTTATLNFTNNCSLSPGSYYMTPFVSRRPKAALPTVILTDNTGNTITGTFNGNAAYRYNTGALVGVPAIDPCNLRPAPTFTVSINVIASNQTNLNFDFHPANNCSSTNPRYITNNPLNSNGNGGVGTFTFTQSQLTNFDPALGFCFWVYSSTGALTATFTVSVTVSYPGVAEVTFPSFERACNIGTSTPFTIYGAAVAPTAANKTVCVGGNTTLSATGVIGSQYIWYGPNSTTTIAQAATTANTFTPTNTLAGSYTYYVSQVNVGGCESTKTPVILTVNAAPSAIISNIQTGCGSPILDAGSGVGKTYLWSTGSTTQTLSVSQTGIYTVTITQNSCTNSGSFNVTALGLLATANSNSPLCNGATLNLLSSGGTSYAWSGPNGFISSAQNPSISNVTLAQAGIYTVTVTGTNGGTTCTATANTVVSISAVNATASNSSPVCLNANATLSASGGVGYAWAGPNGFMSILQNPVVTNVTSAKAGVYTVTVSNSTGCTATATTAISLGGPTATAGSNTPCLGATINLTASGGTSYVWSGPNSFTSTLQNPTISNATAAKAGTYTVTATDANGCTATATTMVSISTVTATASNNGPLCAGAVINLSSAGGATYTWAGPNAFTSVVQNPTISNATTAKAGIYTVTVTNANGCTATATTKVILNATTDAMASNSGAVCQGGTVTLNGNSTTMGVTYAWSGSNGFSSNLQNPVLSNAQPLQAGVYTVTVTATIGCSATATTTVSIGAVSTSVGSNSPVCTNGTILLTTTGNGTYAWTGPNGFTSSAQNPIILNATTANSGNYTLTVTATNGCTATAVANVTVSSIAALVSTNSPVCKNATLNLSALGGGTYAWSGPNSFTSTLQNPSIALFNTPQTGIYTVTVTAAGNACSATATTVATMNTPVANANNSGAVCQGGNVTITASSDGTPSTYAWSGANGFTSNLQTNTITNTQSIDAGAYTVTVTNVAGCVATATTNVAIGTVTAAAITNSPICTNSTLTLGTPDQGAGSTYSWSGPNGFASTLRVVSIANAVLVNAGVYTVTVTAANGCTATSSTTVAIGAFAATATSNSPVCKNNSISLSATSGGTAYSWAGPNGFTSALQSPTIANATNAKAGIYTVTVTSGTCTATATVNVTVVIVTATANNNSGCAGATLTLSATGNGTYAWTGPNGFTSSAQNPSIANITTANAGIYTVTVSNSDCLATATTVVSVGNGITATATAPANVCIGSAINLGATSTGGTNLITNGNFEAGNTGFSSNYNYVANNASANGQYGVVSNPNLWASWAAVCSDYDGNGNMLVADGATTANKRLWYATIAVTPNTNYELLMYAASITNTNPARLQFALNNALTGTETTINTTNCQWQLISTTFNSGSNTSVSIAIVDRNTTSGGNDFAIDNIVCKVTNSYAWSGPSGFTSSAQNPTRNNATTAMSGTYTVTVTPAVGCSATASVMVTVGGVIATAAANSPVCAGSSINLSAAGGTSYAWTGPSGFTSSAQNPTRSNANTAMAGTYTATVTAAGGCTATATTTVTVNAATATANSNSPVCAGNTLNLTATGGASYAWTGANGFTSSAQNPSITNFGAENVGTYAVTVTTANGCTATATATAIVGGNITATASNSSPACVGGTFNLTATTSGGGNLVTNGGFTSGNTGFSSDYSNTTSRSNTRQYGIVTNPNSWYGYFSDCTGYGGSGNMLVADGATTAGLRVWYQTISVTPNTTYQLSAFAQSVYNGTSARLFFTVNGTQVGNEYNLGTNPCTWIQMASTFNSGTSTSITIAIANNETASTAGNNFALDDITCQAVITYGWSGPNGFTSSAQNPTINNATTAMTGVYTVMVSSPGTCAAIATTTVSVGVSSVSAANNGPVCAGGNVALTASGGTSYVWSGPNGFTSSAQNPTRSNATTAMAGIYTVTVTISGGCTATATTNVTVNSAAATATNSGAACNGATVGLTATGGGTYVWAGANGFTSSAQNPNIVDVSVAKTGIYTVTVTATNGCTATATTNVTLSTVTATANSNSPVAIGSSINLTATGGTSYVWTGANGFTSSAQNPAIGNATAAMSGVYIVMVTNAAGCTATASTNVLVSTAAATASSNSPVCAGTTLQLSATGGVTYVWSGPSSFTATTQNPTRTSMTNARAGVYTVTVTTASGTTATATTNVTVSTITIAPNYNDVVCDGATLQLTANPTAGTISSILWTGPDGTTSTQTNPSVANATDNYEGNWTVVATNSIGCTDTKTLNVWVNQVHGYIEVGGDTWQNANGQYYICKWDYLEINADNNDNGVEGVDHVYWTGPNGVSANSAYVGVTVPSLIYTGTYTAYVTDGYGCTEALSFYLNVINCSNKDDLPTATNYIAAQPNPFNYQTTISFSVAQSGNTQLFLYDVAGKQIAELYNNFTDSGSTYQTTIDADRLTSGIYLIKMITENSEVTTYKLNLLK